jgi:PAS domain S-box-containing protein
VELDDTQHEVQLREKDIEMKTREIDELTKQFTEKQKIIEENTHTVEHLQLEQETLQHTVEEQMEVLTKKEMEIQHIEKKVEEKQREADFRAIEVKTKKDQIQKLQAELEQRTHEVERNNEELRSVKDELDHMIQDIHSLTTQKERLNFFFQKMQNSIPVSLIITDTENKILNWNKKAEDVFGETLKHAKGADLFSFELMEKERLRDAVHHSHQEKKPITVKSISLKDQQGNRYLSNIEHIPLMNDAGELQGSLLVIVDVSAITEVQSKLNQSEEELRNLEQQFQVNNTRLKVLDMEKNAVLGELTKLKTELDGRTNQMIHIHDAMDEKQRELEAITESLAVKTNELHMVTTKLEGIKSVLELLDAEKQKRIESDRSNAAPNNSWKENIKIFDEIDKCLNITSNGLKTKKLQEEEFKESS